MHSPALGASASKGEPCASTSPGGNDTGRPRTKEVVQLACDLITVSFECDGEFHGLLLWDDSDLAALLGGGDVNFHPRVELLHSLALGPDCRGDRCRVPGSHVVVGLLDSGPQGVGVSQGVRCGQLHADRLLEPPFLVGPVIEQVLLQEEPVTDLAGHVHKYEKDRLLQLVGVVDGMLLLERKADEAPAFDQLNGFLAL